MGKEEDEVDDDKKEPSLDDVLAALQKLVPVLTALQPKAEKPTPAAKPAAAKPATPAKKELDEEEILESFAKELDGTEIEKDYFSTELRRQMIASGEAMPTGSFPVRDKDDIACAIKAFPRAKDSDAARDHIMSRAKALDAEEMIPKEWTAPPVEDSVLEETHKELVQPEQDMLTRVAHLLHKQSEQRTFDKWNALLDKVDKQVERTKSKTIQTQRSLLKAMGRDPGDLENN